MLLKQESSGVLLIDVQEKLTPSVLNTTQVVDKCHWIMKLAQALSIPTLISEQYPKGLGATVSPLHSEQPSVKTLSKTCFSCVQDENMRTQISSMDVTQWVLIGIETHVCVLQTAIDLMDLGFGVYVAVDAVSARKEIDHQYGLKRIKQHGAELVTSEMIFFEWIKQAGTPEFKSLSQRFLRSNEWK